MLKNLAFILLLTLLIRLNFCLIDEIGEDIYGPDSPSGGDGLEWWCNSLDPPVTDRDITTQVLRRDGLSLWDRPVRNSNKPITVRVRLTLASITDVVWQDEFRIWNLSAPLKCVNYIVLPSSSETTLWQPSVTFKNSDFRFGTPQQGPTDYLVLFSNGKTTYSPFGSFEVRCQFDLLLFPFDVQKCQVQLEGSRYNAKHQLIQPDDPAFEVSEVWVTEGWNFDGIDFWQNWACYPSEPDAAFPRVNYQLVLRRKGGLYSLTIIAPTLVISLTEIVTFAIPFDEADRLQVSLTCLIAFSVFQSLIIESMPKCSDHPPLLYIFVTLVTIYIALTALLQGLILYLSKRAKPFRPRLSLSDEHSPRPCLVKCLPTSTSVIVENNPHVDKFFLWACFLDRFLFFLFASLILTTLIVVIIIVPFFISSVDSNIRNFNETSANCKSVQNFVPDKILV